MHASLTNVREEYGAVIAQRRSQLQLELDRVLASHPTFLWEIGCGHGHFLTAYANAHPKRECVGIDLVGERIERAQRKRDRAKLTNLHFLRADARLFLDTLPPTPCISDVFVLFPDPWPKSRHHKHRVLQPEFLAVLATRATRDCRLHFRTDYRPYFDDARATVAESPLWELAAVPWPFEFETVFQSRAERHDSFIARRKPTGS
jgi:tRNA (guanine-N7-)-methyltransferase